MAQTRRSFLHTLAALLLALPFRAKAAAPDKLALAIATETSGAVPVESAEVLLEAPDVAEDGALVPVSLESRLPGCDRLWIFVEKNPVPLAACFDFAEDADPFVSLRIKMNESCELVALARAEGGYFSARKKVRVVVGGCG